MTRGLTKVAMAVVCALGALIGVAVILRPDGQAGPCVVTQRAQLSEIPEASGLAVSRRHPRLLWSHNDSGNAPDLFAIDSAGVLRGRVEVPVRTRDWEDISAARCPSGDCLFLGDIGDNDSERRRIQIIRVPEPAAGDEETGPVDVFRASYADGPHNAEAMFVVGADVFVITRDGTGGIYRAALPDGPGRDLTLQRIGQVGLAAVTDAEASPDEQSIVVRTSHEAIIYRTADLIRGGAVPYGLRIPLNGLREPQGEGVALDANGMLYLASEGSPWNRAGRLVTLRCLVRPTPRLSAIPTLRYEHRIMLQ